MFIQNNTFKEFRICNRRRDTTHVLFMIYMDILKEMWMIFIHRIWCYQRKYYSLFCLILICFIVKNAPNESMLSLIWYTLLPFCMCARDDSNKRICHVHDFTPVRYIKTTFIGKNNSKYICILDNMNTCKKQQLNSVEERNNASPK